jgi:predicted O-methyltransferase YrrM
VKEEVVIPTMAQSSLAYTEGYLQEDEVLRTARRRAAELGVQPISPGTGAVLRFLTASLDARAVVEIGTGTGVSGVWLLRGMRPDGVLTSVDGEPEHQRQARETLRRAGFPANRTRLIYGQPVEVLPRLADGGYDLVFCDGDKTQYGSHYPEAVRLLRVGGVVVFDNALWQDRVADPAHRDPETVEIRELVKAVRDDDRLVPVLLPVGDGLLCAVRR